MYAAPNLDWFAEQRRETRRTFGDMCAVNTLGERSAQQVIDELFRTPEVRMLLYQLAIDCGVTLNEVGSDLAFFSLVIWMAGRWRLSVGGMQTFSDAMSGAALTSGVRIRFGKAVRRILLENGKATGVETSDGSSIVARTGVVAAIPGPSAGSAAW